MTTKEIIEKVLTNDDKARSNDLWLWICVMREMGFKFYLDYHELEKVPSPETVRRTRAKLQNEEKRFLPEEEELRLQQEREKKGSQEEELPPTTYKKTTEVFS